MKIYLLLTFFIFSSFKTFAQEAPIHNYYFMNPYVYNPSFVGHDGYPVVFLSHRRQWVGVEDAPVSSNLSFHTQLTKTVAVGVNLYTETRGLLTTSSAELAIGYKLKLGREQYIQFGLAAGAGNNRIDLTETQLGAIPLQPSDNSIHLNGRFGIKYHYKNLNIGLALPSLFERDYITNKSFGEISIDPLSYYSATASYKFIISKNVFAFEPHILYRNLGNDFTQTEATGVFYIKEIVWAGASYRTDYGMIGLVGLKIKDILRVGYAYEMATAVVSGLSNGSHEIQISIQLGEKKDFEGERIRRPRFDTQSERY